MTITISIVMRMIVFVRDIDVHALIVAIDAVVLAHTTSTISRRHMCIRCVSNFTHRA